MKTEKEIREQLKTTYEHRLSLRISRKEKNSCKNCKDSILQTLDLGQFGDYVKYSCNHGLYENKCNSCPMFKCKYTREEIEAQMIQDIKDPSICGCKQPKIAALLWVLHNSEKEEKQEQVVEEKQKKSIFSCFFGGLKK